MEFQYECTWIYAKWYQIDWNTLSPRQIFAIEEFFILSSTVRCRWSSVCSWLLFVSVAVGCSASTGTSQTKQLDRTFKKSARRHFPKTFTSVNRIWRNQALASNAILYHHHHGKSIKYLSLYCANCCCAHFWLSSFLFLSHSVFYSFCFSRSIVVNVCAFFRMPFEVCTFVFIGLWFCLHHRAKTEKVCFPPDFRCVFSEFDRAKTTTWTASQIVLALSVSHISIDVLCMYSGVLW